MSFIQGSLSAPQSPTSRHGEPTSSLMYSSRLVTRKLAQARTGGNNSGGQALSLLQKASGLGGGEVSGVAPTAPKGTAASRVRAPMVMHIRVRPSLPVSYTDAGLVPSGGRADEILVSALNSFSHFLDTSGADLVGNPPSTDPMHYSFYVQRPALLRPGLLEGAKHVARRLDAAYVNGKPFTTQNGRPASPFQHGVGEPRMRHGGGGDEVNVSDIMNNNKRAPSALRERGTTDASGIFGSITREVSCAGSDDQLPSQSGGDMIPQIVESSGSSSSSSDEEEESTNNKRGGGLPPIPSNSHSRKPSGVPSPLDKEDTTTTPMHHFQRRGSQHFSDEKSSPEMSADITTNTSASQIDPQYFAQHQQGATSAANLTAASGSGGNLLLNVPIDGTSSKQRAKRSETSILDEDYEECGPDVALCRFVNTIQATHREQVRSMRQQLERSGYNSRKVMRLCEFMLRDAASLSTSDRDMVKQWDPNDPSPWEDDADDPILAHEDETRNVRTHTPETDSIYDVPAPTVPSSKGGLLQGSHLTDAARARHMMQGHHMESRRRREEAAETHRVMEVFVMLRKPFILSEQLVFREVKTRSAVQFVWEQSWKSIRLYEQLWFSRSLAAQQFRERNTIMQQQAIGNETKCRNKIAVTEAAAWAKALEVFSVRYKELEYGMTAQYHHIRALRERLRGELDSGVAAMHGGTNPYTKPVEDALELLERKRRTSGGGEAKKS